MLGGVDPGGVATAAGKSVWIGDRGGQENRMASNPRSRISTKDKNGTLHTKPA